MHCAESLPDGAFTRLERRIRASLARDCKGWDGDAGVAVISDPTSAFTVRADSARDAERSLDLQYYIWRADLSGQLLAEEAVRAADRGVKVRLLLDGIYAPGRERTLAALNGHPGIEVRLFNGARWRIFGRFSLLLELAFGNWRLNRRMHNKAWIADGRVAVVGGRNIGDEYFDAAHDTNFHDADLLLLGHAVAQTGAIFDRFWNSAEVLPLAALKSQAPDAKLVGRWRAGLRDATAASPWVRALGDRRTLAVRLDAELRPHWSAGLRVLSDPPEKAAPVASRRAAAHWLLYDLLALLYSAERQSWLISPYFVPGDGGSRALLAQAARGMDVRVLTNSLAANDVPVVHAGYQRYRLPLLAGGVRLFELKPGTHADAKELLGSSGASLHTEAVVIDGRRGFVGSFNFDPRSVQLNTEMGVVFDDPALAREVQALFTKAAAPASAWAVRLRDDGTLAWQDAAGVQNQEPGTSWGLRALTWLLGWLPIESQL